MEVKSIKKIFVLHKVYKDLITVFEKKKLIKTIIDTISQNSHASVFL